MDLGLEGKTVIVTGGASGIGKATVESFAEEGASVIISDINHYAAQKLAEKVVRNGMTALAVKTDVTKKSDVDNLLSATLNEFAKIDILANIAGVGPKYLGLKFRRQHQIGLYIVDFYCDALKLIIEIDGGIHLTEKQKIIDGNRTDYLKNEGFSVIRYQNELIFTNFD